MAEIYLLTISGGHQAGQADCLFRSLAEYPVEILDICQAEIYGAMTLAVLVELPSARQAPDVLKDLLYTAHSLGLAVEYQTISLQRYQEWVQRHAGRSLFITVLGKSFAAGHIAAITGLVQQHGLEIERINRLSGRKPLQEDAAGGHLNCFEFSVRGNGSDIGRMRADCLDISREHGIDIGLQEDTAFRRYRRLIAFDMDSTLIQAEIIDELAEQAGVRQEVEAITAAAMQGEMDFQESLTRRVALLRGLDSAQLERVAEAIPLTEGAERLIANLKVLGYKIAVLSGGFSFFGRRLQERLGIDYLYANELEIENGRLSGKISGQIVDGQKKAELLRSLAERERISLEQVVAVGDGANDLPMLNLAGLGVAFHAKPVVRQGAKQAISNVGLDAILYFLGLTDREALL
jgi:phosphoserine phosphatase